MQTTFIVKGTVLGKPRPRFANGRCYTPIKFVNYEREIAKAFLRAGGKRTVLPVQVDILISRPLPKGRKKDIIEEEDTFKPDIDNIVKIVLDGLNGVAYVDDTQVTKITAVKANRQRGIEEQIQVTVKERN